jgi:FkbM family methyltransferase
MEDASYGARSVRVNSRTEGEEEKRGIVFRRGTADEHAINQVFEAHSLATNVFTQNRALNRYYAEIAKGGRQVPYILDVGAHIGCASVWYATMYRKAFVEAVEPDPANCSLLRVNTVGLNVNVHQAALGPYAGTGYLIDPGHGTWGYRMANAPGEAGVPVSMLTGDTLVAIANATPFIAKVDVEGFEEVLFQHGTAWMQRFALLVVEIHDWMRPGAAISRPLLRKLGEGHYDVMLSGEHLMCFNNNVLAEFY